jgi:hypothetical protein
MRNRASGRYRAGKTFQLINAGSFMANLTARTAAAGKNIVIKLIETSGL